MTSFRAGVDDGEPSWGERVREEAGFRGIVGQLTVFAAMPEEVFPPRRRRAAIEALQLVIDGLGDQLFGRSAARDRGGAGESVPARDRAGSASRPG